MGNGDVQGPTLSMGMACEGCCPYPLPSPPKRSPTLKRVGYSFAAGLRERLFQPPDTDFDSETFHTVSECPTTKSRHNHLCYHKESISSHMCSFIKALSSMHAY